MKKVGDQIYCIHGNCLKSLFIDKKKEGCVIMKSDPRIRSRAARVLGIILSVMLIFTESKLIMLKSKKLLY